MARSVTHFNRAAWAVLLGLCQAELAPGDSCGHQGLKLGAMGGLYLAGEATAIGLRQADWWTTPRTGFRLVWDASPSAGQDRLLHAAIGYHASQAGAAAFRWACLGRVPAAWLGAGLGLAVGLPKEIGDGFHQGKGFSVPDMLWTALGSALPAVRRTWRAAEALSLKVNYWPSPEYRNRTGAQPELESDYAGQRYYLAVAPGRIPVAGNRWPRWLGWAVGHSVPYWASQPPVHRWYLALDLQFRELPIRARWWPRLAWVLDQVHWPLPGVCWRQGAVEAGLF